MEKVLTQKDLEIFLFHMDGASTGSDQTFLIWQDLKRLVNNENDAMHPEFFRKNLSNDILEQFGTIVTTEETKPILTHEELVKIVGYDFEYGE